ncbi:hypothetical protein Tco_1110564 [Tanacetum coccineum]|uniref:Uncharacterized protein n=1 Tax=Tanacetum coccineum TaxID=301880 RepID=A0ABQ5IJK9_9ASTR
MRMTLDFDLTWSFPSLLELLAFGFLFAFVLEYTVSAQYKLQHTNTIFLVAKPNYVGDGLGTVQTELEIENELTAENLFVTDTKEVGESSDDDEIKWDDLTELVKDKGIEAIVGFSV